MADVTQAEVLAQLRTRGFEEGFQRTPLRDFWGVLTDISGQMRDGDRGAYLVALYNFAGIEVIDSTETYISPIAQIEVAASSRAMSGMGYLGKSIDNIINAGLPSDAPADQVKNQDFLIGKKLHMKLTPGHMIWNQRAGEERPRDCWELIEIAGVGAAPVQTVVPPPATGTVQAGAVPVQSAAQAALAILDGKNEQQWHQEVFVNDIVKADAELVKSIIGRTFLPPLETAGIVTKDENGIYHVKH